MKFVFNTISLLITVATFSQNNVNDLKKSPLFAYEVMDLDNMEYANGDLLWRTFEKDTIINNKSFKKYNLTSIKNFEKDLTRKELYYYESFDKNMYEKLNDNLTKLHSFKTNVDTQQGLLFGQKTTIKVTLSSAIDDLTLGNNAVSTYSDLANPTASVKLSVPHQWAIEEDNDNANIKQLFGDFFTKLAEGIRTNKQTSNKQLNKVGDELQVVYNAIAYDATTGKATRKDTYINDFKVVKEVESNGKKGIVIELRNSKSAVVTKQTVFLDNNLFVFDNNTSIPAKTYTRKKAFNDNEGLILEGVTDIKVGGRTFPAIHKYTTNGLFYTKTLSFFPVYLSEKYGVESRISYAKINNVVYGKKISL